MKNLLIMVVFLLLGITAKAQFLDSLQVQAGTSVTIASKDYLPLWLVANRFGVISDQKFDFSTHLRATNSHRLGPRAVSPDNLDNKAFYIDYGVDLYNNDHLHKTIVQEAFVKARYKHLQLSAGRFKQIIGEVDPDLSSGSLGVSGNALPIPKVNLSIAYTDVPFTNGWVQFKGMISHGWMGDHQFLKGACLHEKNLYLRLGKNKLKIYGGIQHYTIWGGYRDGFFSLDRSFKGFLDVFLGKEANDGSVFGDIAPNRPGDQRGIIEAGAEWENDDIKINLNNQTPFDMGQNIDIRNIDRLLSLNITNKKPDAILKKIVVEFLHTKQMNDFYAQRFRESYYNNGIYRTGWEYNDHIIGTPLFINRVRGAQYFDNVKPFDWNAPTSTIPPLSNIISNRVVGGHVGFLYAITRQFAGKTLITYTNNYGNYNAPNFDPSKSQWYSLQEFDWNLPDTQLSFSVSMAYDWGQLSNNFGSMIGLQWQLRK
jgi:hypothetical protein